MPATRRPRRPKREPQWLEKRESDLRRYRRDRAEIQVRLRHVRELLARDPTVLTPAQERAMAAVPGLVLRPLRDEMSPKELAEYFVDLERQEAGLLKRLCQVEALIRKEERDG